MSKTQSINENNLQIGQYFTKNGDSARKRTTKKQVFGEIKNVIHNHGMPTPLKPDTLLINKTTTKKLMHQNVLRMKHHSKQGGTICTSKTKSNGTTAVGSNTFDEINLLDYFDFRGECCSKPYKSDQQIWSEMNLYDDSLLHKIIEDDVSKLEDARDCNMSNYNDTDRDVDTIDELKYGFNYNYWPDAHANNHNSNLSFFVEKPCIDDFEFS